MGDGVDLTVSLQESVTGKWNGDEDLGDGKLQQLRSEYLSRVDSLPKPGSIVSATSLQQLIHSIEQGLNRISDCELAFLFPTYLIKIFTVLKVATQSYETLLQSGKADKVKYNAGWKVEELSKLNKDGRQIVVEMKVFMQSLHSAVQIDKDHKMYKIGIDLSSFLKGI